MKDETAQKFSALNEVKLSAEDKADILQTLRMEMNRNKPRKKFNRGAISGFAAAAAAVVIVAGGFGLVMHKQQSPQSPLGGATTARVAHGGPDSQSSSHYANEVAVIQSQGYSVTGQTPTASVETSSGGTLTAWIGVAMQSDGHNQYVFFFLDGKYLGTDTAKPSLEITSAKAAQNGIAVTYPVYKTNDSYADPTGTPVTITYTWTGSKLVPNKPYPQQFQGSNSTSQGQNSITTTSYSTSTEAANAVASIQGGNGVGAGSPTVNLGNGIIASESAAMGQGRYVWQEGNWTIQVRFYTRNSNTAVKQVAENMVTYLHTNALPAPNGQGVIVVESTDSNTTSFQPKTTIAWQEGTKVNELQQTGNPVQALQTVVNSK